MVSPLQPAKSVVTGIKDKFDSLLVQGDRIYAGTSTGNLHIYSWDDTAEDEQDAVHLLEIKKGLTRRAIEQLGFIKDINSLVVLSESAVTLFPLPSLSPPTQLPKAKAAFSFAVHTAIQRLLPDGTEEKPSDVEFGSSSKTIPTLVTQLLIGCRRKVVLYSWKDGEPQETKEGPLPHSPRAISFFDKDTASFAYAPDYAIFNIPSMSVTDVVFPSQAVAASTAGSALTGLTGYMTLGLGSKPKPAVVQLSSSEVLLPKDNEGIVIGKDGRPSSKANMVWPAPPEELDFLKPYVCSVLPAGTVPDETAIPTLVPGSTPPTSGPPQAPTPSFIPTSVLQIRSSVSTHPSQNIAFPFTNDTAKPSTSNVQIRLLTPSPPTSKNPNLLLMTTPLDRSTASSEGSTIWQFSLRPWSEQVDDLVNAGRYADALALLDTLDTTSLSDKEHRLSKIRALNAVSQFQNGQYDEAIDTFLSLDINPAKVIALYPENISGRLAVPSSGWIGLFGGPVSIAVDTPKGKTREGSEDKVTTPEEQHHQEMSPADLLSSIASGSIRKKFGLGLGSFMASQFKEKDDDAASVKSSSSKAPKVGPHDDLHRSVNVLVRYLSDRRPKVGAALRALHIFPSDGHPSLETVPVASLLGEAIPDHAPLTSLTPDQLRTFAQIVDTHLFKSYIFVRPVMLGPLCRLENWCEVGEVQEELKGLNKLSELKDLYHGKGMHDKALELLKQQSENETDPEAKLGPSITYLQKLGPEHQTQVFEYSRWMFDVNKDLAFEVFTSEDVELPRKDVADYLEGISPDLCARFLEFLIQERGEIDSDVHDRLAGLYLRMTRSAKEKGDEDARKEAYDKLLHFLDKTDYYQVDTIYRQVYRDDLYEARAILLGKMGQHDQALEMYVYKLADYQKAEEYCKRIYVPDQAPNSDIFLTLLRIYLQPRSTSISSPISASSASLLSTALDLISRHGRRLNPVETLQLLPPLVTTADIRPFLIEALRGRETVFDTRVRKEIWNARTEQVKRTLMWAENRRVVVKDSRICPNCHKRLGAGAIAVHFPRGEVTHYQCREPFSKKLKNTRR